MLLLFVFGFEGAFAPDGGEAPTPAPAPEGDDADTDAAPAAPAAPDSGAGSKCHPSVLTEPRVLNCGQANAPNRDAPHAIE